MLSKEEKLLYSLSSIKEILETLGIDVEVTLTKNDNKYTINAYKEIEKCVVDYVNSLQPYKFEELKKGMWVWDDDKKQCIECAPGKNVMGEKCVWHWYDYDFEGELSEDYIEFEDGRFYPIMKAYYHNQQRR